MIDATSKTSGRVLHPDWLAEGIVEPLLTDPLNERVLDPACGSGTFLFWAVRRYLMAADGAGLHNKDPLRASSPLRRH